MHNLKSRFCLALVIHKPQTNTIHTMPLIRRSIIPLTLKHMAQMATTTRTDNLRPDDPMCPILPPQDLSRQIFVKRWPATARLELRPGLVQRRAAPRAGIHPLWGIVLVVFPRPGGLGALLSQDAELLRRENGLPFLL